MSNNTETKLLFVYKIGTLELELSNIEKSNSFSLML